VAIATMVAVGACASACGLVLARRRR
jgi:hypothetical protein